MGKLQEFTEHVKDFAQKVGEDVSNLRGRVSATEVGLNGKVDKEAGKGLSQENYTTAEKQKLAGLESSKFQGLYPTLAALQTGVPNPQEGFYADVDGGVGEDVARYIWDPSDSKWVPQQSGTPLTAAQVKTMYESNPDTNAYTDAEKSKLAGIEAGAEKNKVISVAGKTGAVTLTKADVGLGSVENYGIASKTEAETGNATNKYMTPLRTREYVDGQIGNINPLTVYNTAAGN